MPIDWTDYNGHMNEARYLEIFSAATDRFMQLVGCDAAYVAAGNSYFTVESHLHHIAGHLHFVDFHAFSRIAACRNQAVHAFSGIADLDETAGDFCIRRSGPDPGMTETQGIGSLRAGNQTQCEQ